MLRNKILISARVSRRYLSHESEKGGKRFIQTIPITTQKSSDFYSSLNYNVNKVKTKNSIDTTNSLQGTEWRTQKLDDLGSKERDSPRITRRSRASRFNKPKAESNENTVKADANGVIEPIQPKEEPRQAKQEQAEQPQQAEQPVEQKAGTQPQEPKQEPNVSTASSTPKVGTEKPKKKRRPLRPRKAIISLSPTAIEHLRGLVDQPEAKYIRIGVQNRGCSGLTYHLEYVSEPGKFDESVEQEGVKVFIDSKALFSIVGSEMDWLDDKLSSRFIFKNPNSKGTCGCGESFMV